MTTTHMTITFPPGMTPPDDPTAGVREPRTPIPVAPAGAIALEEIR